MKKAMCLRLPIVTDALANALVSAMFKITHQLNETHTPTNKFIIKLTKLLNELSCLHIQLTKQRCSSKMQVGYCGAHIENID